MTVSFQKALVIARVLFNHIICQDLKNKNAGKLDKLHTIIQTKKMNVIAPQRGSQGICEASAGSLTKPSNTNLRAFDGSFDVIIWRSHSLLLNEAFSLAKHAFHLPPGCRSLSWCAVKAVIHFCENSLVKNETLWLFLTRATAFRCCKGEADDWLNNLKQDTHADPSLRCFKNGREEERERERERERDGRANTHVHTEWKDVGGVFLSWRNCFWKQKQQFYNVL